MFIFLYYVYTYVIFNLASFRMYTTGTLGIRCHLACTSILTKFTCYARAKGLYTHTHTHTHTADNKVQERETLMYEYVTHSHLSSSSLKLEIRIVKEAYVLFEIRNL
jgi:hypothetical protein